jgi:hypothetical protein
MALSDRYTLAQLRNAARRDLLDTNSRWWTDTELNSYIDDWQSTIQQELELVWGTATITTSPATPLDLTAIATNMLRPDAFYWNNVRLSPRSVEDLEQFDPQKWRTAVSEFPYVAYQPSPDTVGFWPLCTNTGVLIAEYPTTTTFVDDDSVMALPAWTKFSATNYVAYRSYLRSGPNQNTQTALRRKAKFERQLQRLRTLKTNYIPSHFPKLRPGGHYEYDILLLRPYGEVTMPITSGNGFVDETPSGTVNGTNLTFVLSNSPSPTSSLKVWVDGILFTPSTHYTFTGNTITFVEPYQPISGQTVFCSYRYSV